jgi:alkyldihydroxyacetonephosphate synthase
VLRLSDETETLIDLAAGGAAGATDGAIERAIGGPGDDSPGCLLIAGYEGDRDDVADRRARAAAVLDAAGGAARGLEPGTKWERGRFSAPYLRDALLDAGAFAETLETGTFWSDLPRLYQAVREALTAELTAGGEPALVLCHISHVYPAGASLYYTVVCAQGDDPVARWSRAKRAASEAIIAAGGTISHHHGVGLDHRDWMTAEVGPLGVAVLAAIKNRLDPVGILNPGVLVPPDLDGQDVEAKDPTGE